MLSTSTISKPLGPIAKKVVAAVKRTQRRKIVNLAEARQAADEAARIARGDPGPEALRSLPPAFAVCMSVTNWLMGVLETAQELPELKRLVEPIAELEDCYMPSGPPMSPLTRTFFWNWMLFDHHVGRTKETIGSVFLAVASALDMDRRFLAVLEGLTVSRLGLHVHEGAQDGRILLRELVTGDRRACVCPAGYEGRPGELWLARVVPPALPEISDSTVFMTPYVLAQPGLAAWEACLKRTLHLARAADTSEAYPSLMKHGLNRDYWAEFVFEAYSRYQREAIFLVGLPDVAESRPHSRVNAGL